MNTYLILWAVDGRTIGRVSMSDDEYRNIMELPRPRVTHLPLSATYTVPVMIDAPIQLVLDLDVPYGTLSVSRIAQHFQEVEL